jgi:hypothetical protein
MIVHANATNLEQEIGLPKVKNIETGSRNRSRSSGLTANQAVARLFSALLLSRARLNIATKAKVV